MKTLRPRVCLDWRSWLWPAVVLGFALTFVTGAAGCGDATHSTAQAAVEAQVAAPSSPSTAARAATSTPTPPQRGPITAVAAFDITTSDTTWPSAKNAIANSVEQILDATGPCDFTIYIRLIGRNSYAPVAGVPGPLDLGACEQPPVQHDIGPKPDVPDYSGCNPWDSSCKEKLYASYVQALQKYGTDQADAKSDYDTNISQYNSTISQRTTMVADFARSLRDYSPTPDDVCTDLGGAFAKASELLTSPSASGRRLLLVATDLASNCGDDSQADLTGVEVYFVWLECPSRQVCNAREGFWLQRLAGAKSVRFLDPEQSTIFLKDLFR